jgi:hypothetical protein
MRDLLAMWARSLIPVGVAAACIGVGAASAGSGDPAGKVHVAFTGNFSEARETVPIRRKSGERASVIISLRDEKLGRVQVGDRVIANAEFQVTLNCFERSRRCFGRPYDFSPKVAWRLVLAPNPTMAGGPRTEPLSDWRRGRCSYDPPDRNHHCVYVTRKASLKVDRMPPCGPQSCHVNLVLRAHHRAARRGDALAIGGDGADGSGRGDKGRINAILYRPSEQTSGRVHRDSRELRQRIPVHPREPDRKVIYRVRLDALKAGEQVIVDAKSVVGISHLSYSALAQSELVVSAKPGRHELDGIRNFISLGGRIAESNGFNCTQGRSAFQSPCVTRKVAAFRVTKNVVDRKSGSPRSVYVLLLSGLRWHYGGRFDAGEAGRVRGGFLRVERFGPEREL